VRQRYFYLAWFFLHFLFIVTVSCREMLRMLARGPTIFPSSFNRSSQRVETTVAALLGEDLAAPNPARRLITTYLHAAGVERGYGYFAPNVPGTYRLVFELHYHDGRVDYELPRVNSNAAGLRLAGLLDDIGRSRYDVLREYLVKMLARSVWREHPDAAMIRAVLGSISLPSIDEFERGAHESSEFLYAYDFSLRADSAESQKH